MNTKKFQTWLILLSLFISKFVLSQIGPPPAYYKNTNLVFYHNTMGATTQTMYVKNGGTAVLSPCGSPSSTQSLKKGVLNVKLNWGGDNLYTTGFPATPLYSANVVIKAYSSFTGVAATDLVTTYSFPLTVNPSKPQAYLAIDYTSIYASVSRFDITVTISSPSPSAANNITTSINAEEEITHNVYAGGSSIMTINPVTSVSPCSSSLCNVVRFSWATNCVPAPNYQLQVLRLFNNSPSNTTTDNTIQATIDWSKAMTIETGNSLNAIDLTLAEGKGYYLWRVRPIGNTYEGGIANDRNWGSWSGNGSYGQGNTVTISGIDQTNGLFFFDQFDDDKNWIYSRSFMEPDALTKGQVTIGESMSYANGLQMGNQNQTRVNAYDQIVVTQSIYDYAGRATLNTLPSGVNHDYLGYIPSYVKNSVGGTYTASDFDADGNYKDPAFMDSLYVPWAIPGPGGYYSNNNRDEANIPTAHGYPYSRILYSRDGLNRVKEQSGPGEQHRQKSVNAHTTRSSYSAVADQELIRVFGDEAPSENSVVKVISSDPNNTRSVSYISKEGQTIATCVSSPSSTNLRALTPSPTAFTVSKNMVNYIPYGPNGYIAFNNFSFAEQTAVTLNYSISPKTYADICASICATCDYHIEVKLIDLDNPSVPIYTYSVNIAPNTSAVSTSCTAPLATSTSTNLSLPAGDYYVERTIVANNPPAAGTTAFATIIDQNVSALQTNMDAILNGNGIILNNLTGNPVSPTITVAMSQINAYLNATPINLDGLYNYINVQPGEYFKKILFGCDTIRIPVSRCDDHTCNASDNDYLSFFTSKFPGALITNYTTILTQNTDVNLLITNMFNSGQYPCAKLWSCWKNTVLSYQSALDAYNSYVTSLGSVPAFPKKPDLIDMFFNCTGYKIKGIATSAYGSGSVKGYVSDAYGYFRYPAQNTPCEANFINGVNSLLGTSTSAFGSASAFTTYYNGLSSATPAVQAKLDTLKTYFFLCVKNSQPAGASAPATTASVLAQLQTNCNQFCEAQNNSFVSLLTNSFHKAGKYIQGDKYLLVVSPAGGFGVGPVAITPTTSIPTAATIISKKEIYCMSANLIKQCQLNCNSASPTFSTNLSNLYGGTYSIGFPDNNVCPTGYTSVTSNTNDDRQFLLNYMNARLDSVRQNSPAKGVYWDWSAELVAFDPTMLTSGCSNYNKVFVHPSIPSYFELSATACAGLIYNLNKVPTGTFAMGTAKKIYSLSSTLTGFATTPTKITTTIGAITGLSTSNAIVIDSVFVSNATTPPSTFLFDGLYNQTLVNALAYAPTTTIYEYQNAYWSASLNCVSACNHSITCTTNKICFKLTTYTPSIVPSSEINNFVPITCEEQTVKDIKSSMAMQKGLIVDKHVTLFKLNYQNQCLKKENISETFTFTYVLQYHHYTLYYYDRAGNLVKTVSPEGVKTTSTDRTMHPAHDYVTEYDYNSLKQLTRQLSPDGGESKFWYNNKGMLRASQNAKQLANVSNLFSYTNYDALGRINEVGEMPSFDLNQVNSFAYPSTSGTQITRTIYNTPATGVTYLGNKPQRYLQNRISYVLADKDGNITTTNDKVATYYSYDPHGNVEWMIQEQPQLGKNYIGYEYDLISGSVIKVKYNEGLTDQFFHRYTYDIDKRLKKAETSKDQLFWEADARYDYYLHGPLKRSLIGHESVQGLDYTYTIQGWLKGINHASLAISDDAGKDGGTSNPFVARDIFGSVLTYYAGDFVSKSSPLNSSVGAATNPANLTGTDLFNGNISAWRTNIGYVTGSLKYEQQTGNKYYYDELNRLVESNFLVRLGVLWLLSSEYKELMTYDHNGNITRLTRNGYSISSSVYMDDLTYTYYQPGGLKTNRLSHVTEPTTATSPYADDIENQTTGNYDYDQIGNLTKDVNEGISNISWTVYGKIETITYSSGKSIKFLYDANGNRIKKEIWPGSTAVIPSGVEYYVRDAQGNPMAIYSRTDTQVGTTSNYTSSFNLVEQAIYGSDRLGRRKENIALGSSVYTPGSTQPNNPGPVLTRSTGFNYLNLALVNSSNAAQYYIKNISTSNAINTPGSNVISAAKMVNNTPAGTTLSTGRNVAMLHDDFNNRLISAFTYNYASTINKPVTKVFIRDTVPVINDSIITATSPYKQSGFIKRPGSADEYYYITIDANKRPYYHIINATTGMVTSANMQLDANAGYGETMAMVEDLAGQGTSTVFLRRFANSTTFIQAFNITASGITMRSSALASFGTYDVTADEGDIILSTNLNKLAIANRTSATAYEVRVYNLSAAYDALTLSNQLTATEKISKLEYNQSDRYLYFVKEASTTLKYLWRCDMTAIGSSVAVPAGATVSSTVFKTVFADSKIPVAGDLRKGTVSETMFFLGTISTTSYRLYSVSKTGETSPIVTQLTTNISSVITAAAFPMLPHHLYYSTPAPLTESSRSFNNKEYEIKDHLGNVRVVVADFKVSTPVTTGDQEIKFNDGTTGGFTVGGPGGSLIQTQNNRLQIFGPVGANANKTISGLTANTNYVIAFDLDVSNTHVAACDITNGAGKTYGGGFDHSNRQNIVFTTDASGSVNLSFTIADNPTASSIYIDNIEIKKINSGGSSVTVLTDNYTTGTGNWLSGYCTITNTGGKITFAGPTTPGQWAGFGYYEASVIPGMTYMVTFKMKVNSLTSPDRLDVAMFNNIDGAWFDQNQNLTTTTSAGFVNYSFLFVPNSDLITFALWCPSPTSAGFNFDIDDFTLNQLNVDINNLYTAKTNSYYNYSAFGAPQPGRVFPGNGYRYGFNGQEKDVEINAKDGTLNTATFWEYDTRIGRRWNLDPIDQISVSNYACFRNNPITLNDIHGAAASPPDKILYDDSNGEVIGYQEDANGKDYVTDSYVHKGSDGGLVQTGEVTPEEKQQAYERGLDQSKLRDAQLAPSRRISGNMDQFEKGFTVGAVVIFSAPVATAEAGFIYTFGGQGLRAAVAGATGEGAYSLFKVGSNYLGQAAVKGTVDAFIQGTVNGPQNIDVLDVGYSAFLTPYGSALMGSLSDWKPFSNNRTVKSIILDNKGVNNTVLDFSVKLTFGGLGVLKPVNKYINATSFGPYLTPVITMPINATGKGTSNGLKSALGDK